MPDTGAPWNITYVASSDLVKDWPTDNQTMAESIADALDDAWKVRQVVTASTSTTTSTSSTSRVNTSLTATITPTDATSQVLVIAAFEELQSTNSGSDCVVDVYNGTSSSTVTATREDTGSNYGMNITYLDSPASASAVTYTAQVRLVGSAATVRVRGWQTLVLMEVGP